MAEELSPCNRVPSATWLTEVLRSEGLLPTNGEVKAVEEDKKLEGGAAGSVIAYRIQYDGDQGRAPATLVVKWTGEGMCQTVIREAMMYSTLPAEFSTPAVYHAKHFVGEGSENMVVVMEDLRPSANRLDIYHGGQGGSTLRQVEKNVTDELTSKDIWMKAFLKLAETHARHWGGAGLPTGTLMPNHQERTLLKGADWLQAKNRAGWDVTVDVLRRAWRGVDKTKMSKRVVTLFDNSLAGATFEGAVEAMKARPQTLVHGDFHAKNLFYNPASDTILMSDFSEVGLGDPISDLVQYIISDVETAVRRQHEREVMRAYWERLTSCGVRADEFTFDDCWRLYQSGIDRWLFFFPLMAHWGYRHEYFHDTIDAWLEDHQPGVDSVPIRWLVELKSESVQ